MSRHVRIKTILWYGFHQQSRTVEGSTWIIYGIHSRTLNSSNIYSFVMSFQNAMAVQEYFEWEQKITFRFTSTASALQRGDTGGHWPLRSHLRASRRVMRKITLNKGSMTLKAFEGSSPRAATLPPSWQPSLPNFSSVKRWASLIGVIASCSAALFRWALAYGRWNFRASSGTFSFRFNVLCRHSNSKS